MGTNRLMQLLSVTTVESIRVVSFAMNATKTGRTRDTKLYSRNPQRDVATVETHRPGTPPVFAEITQGNSQTRSSKRL
jgi:hypothetical protein